MRIGMDMSGLAQKIYFLRHGQTDWNAESRFQGQRDIPLNQKGRAQAKRNGRTLPALIEDPSQLAFYCSPLSRARETLELALGEAGWSPQVRTENVIYDPRLIELSFGDWEGWTLSDIRQKDPANFALREKSKWFSTPPNGENYDMLCARVMSWLEDLDRPCLVVAHGGVLRAMRHILDKITQKEAPLLEIPQDKIYFWDGHASRWV